MIDPGAETIWFDTEAWPGPVGFPNHWAGLMRFEATVQGATATYFIEVSPFFHSVYIDYEKLTVGDLFTNPLNGHVLGRIRTIARMVDPWAIRYEVEDSLMDERHKGVT